MSSSPDQSTAGSGRLFVVAAAVGALAGLAATGFQLALEGASDLRAAAVTGVHDGSGWLGLLAGIGLVLLPVLTTATAAFLVHRVEPHAEGSGIPRVTAVVQGKATPGRLRILPVKFVGGVLAMGGGLALGREGPSVHMGGVIASVCGRWARLTRDDLRVVIAGGAAAGLATAFDAPIAGGVFVLEELLRRFDPRCSLAMLSASGAGFAVTRLLDPGAATVFDFPALPQPRLEDAPLVLVLGLFCGLAGLAYNRAVLGALRIADRSTMPVVARAGAVGLVVGVVLLVQPEWAGSGDALTQDALSGRGAITTVAVLLVFRFVFGVLSYAANTPGGLFAPMLVLGASCGLLTGLVADQLLDLPAGTASGLALIGMAAFFTASVQAPVTGLILATEMTGSTTWLPPMLGAVAVAMLVARASESPPIYDALAERSARNVRTNAEESVSQDGGATRSR